jgi:hypothetical protein
MRGSFGLDHQPLQLLVFFFFFFPSLHKTFRFGRLLSTAPPTTHEMVFDIGPSNTGRRIFFFFFFFFFFLGGFSMVIFFFFFGFIFRASSS